MKHFIHFINQFMMISVRKIPPHDLGTEMQTISHKSIDYKKHHNHQKIKIINWNQIYTRTIDYRLDNQHPSGKHESWKNGNIKPVNKRYVFKYSLLKSASYVHQ